MFKTKAGTEHEGKLESLFKINEILWRVALLQACIIVALVYGYLCLRETVNVNVELPSKIYQSKNLTIKKGLNWANADFYDVWGLSLVFDMSSFDSNTVGEKYALLQKMMRPTVALKHDNEIQTYVKSVIANKISQSFVVMQHKPPEEIAQGIFRLVFNGIVTTKIGNKELPRKECNYTVDFKIYEDGVLYVENFGTNCMQ